MPKNEIEEVLSNWIREANSPLGTLTNCVDPAHWAAKRFLEWWKDKAVATALDDAEGASHRMRGEFVRLGGWNNQQLGEVMHEMIHLEDAIADLRRLLGLPGDLTASGGETQPD